MYFVLVFQNVISLSVNLADNIMLGAYSEVSLSGVAAVNQIQFIYQQLLMAAGDGMVIFWQPVLGKESAGACEKKLQRHAMHTGLILLRRCFWRSACFRNRRSVCLPQTRQSLPKA